MEKNRNVCHNLEKSKCLSQFRKIEIFVTIEKNRNFFHNLEKSKFFPQFRKIEIFVTIHDIFCKKKFNTSYYAKIFKKFKVKKCLKFRKKSNKMLKFWKKNCKKGYKKFVKKKYFENWDTPNFAYPYFLEHLV
mgnify:CR=1 FL=1